MDTPAVSNIPDYSVSDLAGAIRRTLEGAFGRVRVRGRARREIRRDDAVTLREEGADQVVADLAAGSRE